VISRRPNPRLQRTRAALLLLSLPGGPVSSGGSRRAPLRRQPLGASATRWLRVLASVCGFVAVGLTSRARAQTMEAKIDAFGIFREIEAEGGRNVVLVRQTETLEACTQTRFGYHVVIGGLRPGSQITFRKVVKYPPMRKPDKSTSTGYESSQTTTVRSDGTVGTFQGYGLDERYECVPGSWTIEYWYGQIKLVTKTFSLTKCSHS